MGAFSIMLYAIPEGAGHALGFAVSLAEKEDGR